MGKNHPNVDPYVVSRVRALESLLLEKGILARRRGRPRDPALRGGHRAAEGRAGGRARLGRPRVQAAPARGRARRRSPSSGSASTMLRRGREHADGAQHGRLHALLLLPVGGAGPAAHLVQDAGLPLARGDRAARGAARVRPGGPRDAARSASGTAARSCATWCCPSARRAPRARRGRARAAGHARRHDRRGADVRLPAPARWPRAMYERRRNLVVAPRRPPRQRRALARPALRLRRAAAAAAGWRTASRRCPPSSSTASGSAGGLRNVVHLTIGGCLGPARSPTWCCCSSTARRSGSTR